MKKRITTFLSGMLTMALIGGLGVTALAATGQMTITVDPINIQVNGQTFQPKDAQGNDVPVFAYNGTTYAPLRALAEAYGLTVGYDQEANMATVGKVAPTTTPAPDTTATTYSDWTDEVEAAYQEFKGMWEVEQGEHELTPGAGGKDEMTVAYVATYIGEKSLADLKETLVDNPTYKLFYQRMCSDLILPDCTQISIWFGHKDGYNNSFGVAVQNSKEFYIVGWVS